MDVGDEEALRIMLSDNQTAAASGYDQSLIQEMMAEIAATPDGLIGTGYDDGDLRAMIDLDDTQDVDPPEPVASAGHPDAVVKIGPYRWAVPREKFTAWRDKIKEKVGGEPKAIQAEIKRLLEVS